MAACVRESMKLLCAVAGVVLMGGGLSVFAQTEVTCGQTLQAPMRSGGVLTIDSRPAGLDIVGTDQAAIRVTCRSRDRQDMEGVKVRLSGSGGTDKLKIHGGESRHGGAQIRIEVPRRTSVRVGMGAGQVTVENLEGNKDIELYAGQITISSKHRWDYRSVDASVTIGQVSAPAYGEDKGGFFRSFSKEDPNGVYRLHAHVTTGQIVLEGTRAKAAAD